MPDFNPGSPEVIGPEWRGFYSYPDVHLGAGGPRKAMRLPSTVTQTIADLQIGIGPTSPGSLPLFVLAEIYDDPGLVLASSAFAVAKHQPDAHGSLGIGLWRDQAGGSTTIYNSINESVVYPVIGTDYIRTQNPSQAVTFKFNTSAFPLTRRVGRLRFRSVSGTSGGFRDIYYRLHHIPSGVIYRPPGDKIRTHYYGTLNTIDLGEINPATALPWSPADVRSFSSTGPVWEIWIFGSGSSSSQLRVHNLELEVQYATTENRLAVGTWQRGEPGEILVPSLITTDDLVRISSGAWVNGWSKVSGTEPIFVLRRATDRMISGTSTPATDIRWHFVGGADQDGPNPPPIPDMRSADITLAADGSMVGAVISATDFTGHLAGTIVPIVSGTGAPSVDSQPYMARDDTAGSIEVADTTSLLHTFVAPATASYLGVRFVVKPPDDGVGTLRVTVHSWNGTTAALADTQVGGKVDISAEDLLDQPAVAGMVTGFREVRGFLDIPASLTSGGDYYLKFNKIDGTAGSQWVFHPIDSDGNTAVGFQGTADGFVITMLESTGANTQITDQNLGAVIYQQPAPPSGVGSAVVTDPQVFTYGGCVVTGASCDVEAIDGVQVSWGTPGYSGMFASWALERRDMDSSVWWPIARGTEEAIRTFIDYEGLRDKAATYRVRAELTDGSFSAWVSTAPVALELTPALLGNVTTPDGPNFLMTGDLDVRVWARADDWSFGFGQFVVGQYGAAGNQSWAFGLNNLGNLVLIASSDGTNNLGGQSSVVVPFANGSVQWIRVTLDVNNGAGGHAIRFYTSPDGVTWTQLGTTQTVAGTMTLFNSTADVSIGIVLPFVGDIRYVEVRNAIDGPIVADPDFVAQAPGDTSFADSIGNVWSVNGDAAIVDQGTGVPSSHDAEVIYTSNARPELNVAYTFDPDVPVEFLDHENDRLMAVQGAPFRVAFHDPFDRGIGLVHTIRPVFGDMPVDEHGHQLPIEAVFQPLVDIARSRGNPTPGTPMIPYVCVLDYEGGRRFAYIKMTRGSREMPEFRYAVDVTALPLTDRPAEVEF